jgi:hypothetical protein
MQRLAYGSMALLSAVVAIAIAATESASAQSTVVRGIIRFERGGVIPKGHLEVYLEDRAGQDKIRRSSARARIDSDGRSEAITFSLAPAETLAASPTLQVVARLERADGWLVARGSAQLAAGSPVNVILDTVMY